MIDDFNTTYPVRSLAERQSTVDYFAAREIMPYDLLVRSDCHEYMGKWNPEREPIISTLRRSGASHPEIDTSKATRWGPITKDKARGTMWHLLGAGCVHSRRPSDHTKSRVLGGLEFAQKPMDEQCWTCRTICKR